MSAGGPVTSESIFIIYIYTCVFIIEIYSS